MIPFGKIGGYLVFAAAVLVVLNAVGVNPIAKLKGA